MQLEICGHSAVSSACVRPLPPPSIPHRHAIQCAWFYDTDTLAQSRGQELFEKLDTNQSGSLDAREMAKARRLFLRGAQTSCCVTVIADIFNAADEDNNGEVDHEEWDDFIRSIYEVSGRKAFLDVTSKWISYLAAQPELRPATAPAKVHAVEADVSSHEEHAAATRIQAIYRGRQRTRTTTHGRHPPPNSNQKTPSTVQPLTTITDLWEILTMYSHTNVSLPVAEVVELFEMCRDTGVNKALAELAPLHLENVSDHGFEDLSPGEVAHLCMLLIGDPDLTEERARQEIAPIKDEMRSREGKYVCADKFSTVSLRIFRHAIKLFAALMRIDEAYFVLQMSWCKTGCFEMTEELFDLFITKCVTRRSRPPPEESSECCAKLWSLVAEQDRLQSSEAVAPHNGKFTYVGMHYFCFNANIVHQEGGEGITYNQMCSLFTRVCTGITDLLKLNSERLPRNAKSKDSAAAAIGHERVAHQIKRSQTQHEAHSLFLSGRTEVSVLLQELANVKLMRDEFASPLDMVVSLVQRACTF